MTPISIEEYQDAIRNAVCRMCVCFAEDRQSPGRCVHEHSGQCGLVSHLGEVVNVISGVDSHAIEAYTEALRREVCAQCDHQDERRICNLRDSRGPVPTWCILDAYCNLVVGAVEEVQSMHAAGS